MKFKFSSYSNIIDFPVHGSSWGWEEIGTFLNDLTMVFNESEPSEWTVLFMAIFRKGDRAVIVPKGNSYPSMKEKKFSILIPIPNEKEVSWGVRNKQYSYVPPLDEKTWKGLDVDCHSFDNAKDYVTACAKKGIQIFLKDGITVQGKKIRLD